MENTFEQLIATIERNSENDNITITNVRTWAERWRAEYKGTLEDLIAETELEEYSDSMKLKSIAQILQNWLNEIK